MKTLLLIGLLSVAPTACAQPAAYTVSVEAGDYDRRHTITSFTTPEGVEGALELRDSNGAVVSLQVDAEGMAWFILDRLDAGQTKTYRLEPRQAAPPESVTVKEDRGTVRFSLDAQPVVEYHVWLSRLPRQNMDALYKRGGYLHPVHTPGGRVVTDDYPSNHFHHHGIWAAWTNTVFQGRTPDFWNMGAGTGTVEVEALDQTWGGPVHGGLRARHRYVDLSASEPITALNEQWALRVYNVPAPDRPYHLFDLTLTQTTATDSALGLPEYRYGGVGFRGHWDWNGPQNTVFLTSEGKNRSNGHATRARWCHIGGEVDGEPAGLAMLGHPGNFEAPQPMRIHPTEPFFNFAPSQAGDWSIEPGVSYMARYRFVVYDGLPDAADLDRLWNDYAHPPVVRVGL